MKTITLALMLISCVALVSCNGSKSEFAAGQSLKSNKTERSSRRRHFSLSGIFNVYQSCLKVANNRKTIGYLFI